MSLHQLSDVLLTSAGKSPGTAGMNARATKLTRRSVKALAWIPILAAMFLAPSLLLQAQNPGLSIKLEIIKEIENVSKRQVPMINVIVTNTSFVTKVIEETGVASDNIIVLMDSAGKTITQDSSVRRVPSPGSFIIQSARNVTLEPGKSISSILELQRVFKLKSPESYKVFVKRRFTNVPGEVASNSVEVAVK